MRFVVPELQRRGLFRKDFAGVTLRENLGMPVRAGGRLAPCAQTGGNARPGLNAKESAMKKVMFLLVAMATVACSITTPAASQPYPTKPVRIITANSAGGTSDISCARSATSCRSAGASR